MTTTIAPAAGAAPLYTQQGTGATPGYAALDDRRANAGSLQEGVYGTSTLVTAGGAANVGQADFMVTQRNAGASMSVDINMPAGGFAYVQGDTISGQGLYTVPVHSSTINELIATADVTNPRIDQVILEVLDNALDASGSSVARIRVLTGSATAGATLSNRNGAAALPGSALLLADVAVGAGVGSVGNAVIRDRRKWARGAYVRILRNVGPDYATSLSSFADVDASALKPRLECSGVPLRATVRGNWTHSAASGQMLLALALDGSLFDGASAINDWNMVGPATATAQSTVRTWDITPVAGSHQVAIQFAAQTAGTATLGASATAPLVMTVEEVMRSNAPNNVVTSG